VKPGTPIGLVFVDTIGGYIYLPRIPTNFRPRPPSRVVAYLQVDSGMTNDVLARQTEEPESGLILLAPLVTGMEPIARWGNYSPVFLPPLLANAAPSEAAVMSGATATSEDLERDLSLAAAERSALDPDAPLAEFAEPPLAPAEPALGPAPVPLVISTTPEDASDTGPELDRSMGGDTVIDTQGGEGAGIRSAAGAAGEVTPAEIGAETDFPDGVDEGWRDELMVSALGETEPEDELPFLAADAAFPISTAEPSGARADALARPAALIERAHVEDLADRLEDIAGILREQGPARLLLGQSRDPLSALITGYLVGYLESQARETTADTSGSG
jgi:hypothetical protein